MDGYETESEDTPIEPIYKVGIHQRLYSAMEIGEYFILMENDDYDKAILIWRSSCPINNVTTVAEPQPRSQPSSSSNPKKRSAPLKELKNKPSSFEE